MYATSTYINCFRNGSDLLDQPGDDPARIAVAAQQFSLSDALRPEVCAVAVVQEQRFFKTLTSVMLYERSVNDLIHGLHPMPSVADYVAHTLPRLLAGDIAQIDDDIRRHGLESRLKGSMDALLTHLAE